MKNVIVKTLTVAAAALLATGCVSSSEFKQHVESADAAIKAAQQDAAAAKAAAEAAQSAANGASREQILQAAFMAVAMGGSPKLMYLKYVFEALEDLFD